MFTLTNDQRKCFALKPISDEWECIEARPTTYCYMKTLLYIENDTIVKCISQNDTFYYEYELSEKVTPDRKYLLPKTAKGKPTLLTSSTIQKRRGVGMRLNYFDKYVHLYNENTECSYYFNSYLNDDICDFDGFSRWVENWCNETTDADIEDVVNFSKQKRKHIRFNEGDVFRFKIGRRLYGYGRILLDYDKMRKNKEPFWDSLMCKPIVCSVYHIVTDRDDISVDELKPLGSLPSTIIMDNSLYYGEYEIIGNLPITTNEDYPIMYGNSLDAREKAVYYQCGKFFRKLENETEIYTGFKKNGVSTNLNFHLDVLLQCIKEKSNDPFWEYYQDYSFGKDLRNPKHADKLQKVKEQFGL